MQLRLLEGMYAVCRLGARDPLPAWATGDFVTVTRTADELSIICPAGAVPADVKCESGWRNLKVAGPLEFTLTGVVSSLAAPLASAGISIFAISTFETDYILVKDGDCARAMMALTSAGHSVKQG